MCTVRVWTISFGLMAGSTQLTGQQPLNQEERVRRVSTYYASHYARLNRVPAELVEAIIEAESGWRPQAVSVKGAAGLMQLMPATARRFRVRNRYNLEQNIRGGVEYLAVLSGLFEGDLRLVVAAYLAGEQRVLRRGLDYSSPQVFRYVSRVARLYRQKRRMNRLTN